MKRISLLTLVVMCVVLFGFDVVVAQESIAVQVKISPSALNLKSKGNWINCEVRLPQGYDAADIDPATILLQGSLGAIAPDRFVAAGQVAKMKFSRSGLQGIVEAGEQVVLTVTGSLELVDPDPLVPPVVVLFSGTDTIKVINPDDKKVK